MRSVDGEFPLLAVEITTFRLDVEKLPIKVDFFRAKVAHDIEKFHLCGTYTIVFHKLTYWDPRYLLQFVKLYPTIITQFLVTDLNLLLFVLHFHHHYKVDVGFIEFRLQHISKHQHVIWFRLCR